MRRIRWGAFIGALILAPLTIGVPSFLLAWLLELSGSRFTGVNVVLFIAYFAAIFGAPTYLTFGTGFFMMTLHRNVATTPFTFALAGFLANAVSVPIVAAFSAAAGGNTWGTVLFYNGFGCIFAPLWGAIFAALYTRFSRSIRQTPA